MDRPLRRRLPARGVPGSWRGDLLAACRAGGPRAVASHRGAARLWMLPRNHADALEITCPRWLRRHSPLLTMHESKALDPVDTTEVAGIPVTTVDRTLLDLGAVCRPVAVEMALDDALRRGLVDIEALGRLLDRVGRRGRNGTGVLRRILERSPLSSAVESPMETYLLRVLRAHGLPAPVPQYVVRTNTRFVARVDAAYPDARLAIEYESYQEHTGKLALVRDSARRNQLIAANWIVVTATAADLRTGGDALAAAVRSALRRAS